VPARLQQGVPLVDPSQVRVSFLVYGVVYVVIEIVGHRLETVGWPRITALDVATAVTDAFLIVSVGLAALLAAKLAAERWGHSFHAWWDELGDAQDVWDDPQPIGVRSWRAEPLELPAAPAPAPARGTYDRSPYIFGGRRWPSGPGRQL
jgi:hypothetical protein